MVMVPGRCVYHTEESECIRTANRAEEAELKAKGGTQCYYLLIKHYIAEDKVIAGC